MAVDGPTIRLSDLGGQLKRRWRVIGGTVLVCAVLGAVVGFVRPDSYTATSVLTVNAITLAPYGEGSYEQDVNITTERAVVQSTEVAAAARTIMGSRQDPRDLVERINVTSPLEAQVIEIGATAGSPDRASATANAFAEGYLQVRGDNAREERDSRIRRIDDRLAQLDQELANSAAGADEAVQQEISNLRDQRSGLTGTTINAGRIITTAAPPRQESSLPMPLYLAGGGAAGLLFGVGLALVRERLDGRVRSAARLGTIVGLNVLDYDDVTSADEFANRLIMRLDLGSVQLPASVGVLGTDHGSSEAVSAVLTDHLLRLGYRARWMRWSTGPTGYNGEHPPAPPWRMRGNEAVINVFAASTENGVARTAMLGQRLNRTIVTTSHWSRVHAVVELVDELWAADVHVDVAVVSALRTATEPDAGGTEQARAGSEQGYRVEAGAERGHRSGDLAAPDDSARHS